VIWKWSEGARKGVEDGRWDLVVETTGATMSLIQYLVVELQPDNRQFNIPGV